MLYIVFSNVASHETDRTGTGLGWADGLGWLRVQVQIYISSSLHVCKKLDRGIVGALLFFCIVSTNYIKLLFFFFFFCF